MGEVGVAADREHRVETRRQAGEKSPGAESPWRGDVGGEQRGERKPGPQRSESQGRSGSSRPVRAAAGRVVEGGRREEEIHDRQRS